MFLGMYFISRKLLYKKCFYFYFAPIITDLTYKVLPLKFWIIIFIFEKTHAFTNKAKKKSKIDGLVLPKVVTTNFQLINS